MTDTVRVLVVDDDPVDLELTKRMLSGATRLYFEVDTVTDLSAAIPLLSDRPYDVLLLDLNLARSRGLATLDAIRSHNDKLPVIVLSGLGDEETALKSLDQGAQDYLVKGTVTTNGLVSAISYARQRQQLVQELTRAKELLEKKNRRLARLYKTAHRFVDNVSHEFRTPLTVIKEYCSLVREGIVGDVNEEQGRMLDVISDRADDLNNMVDDMLDVSRLESGMLGAWRKHCCLSDIMNHVRPNLEKKAAVKNVDLVIEVSAGLPQIYCDTEKVGRVIVNLATNAIKFSRDPGRVRITAVDCPESGEIVLEVSDNGPGISPENLEVIFKRFKQIGFNAGSTKGFGLGLNIAKELVELNFGSMNIRSTIGEGSSFSFTIPYAEPLEVLRRYLRRNDRRRRTSAVVSLLSIELDDSIEEAVADDVDIFVSHMLRRTDLLFRAEPRKWLLMICAGAKDVAPFCKRLDRMRSEANRNRPHGSLPEIGITSVGSWRVAGRVEEILNQVKGMISERNPTYV